jgi:hypothetical protein
VRKEPVTAAAVCTPSGVDVSFDMVFIDSGMVVGKRLFNSKMASNYELLMHPYDCMISPDSG